MVEVSLNQSCGASLQEAVKLAKLISQLQKKHNTVSFSGVVGYEGPTPLLCPREKTYLTLKCHTKLRKAKELIEDEGIPVNIVSGGGASNYMDYLKIGILNEIQAGGGVIHSHKAGMTCSDHMHGSLVLTSIVSTSGENAIGDAGFPAVSSFPQPRDRTDLLVTGLSSNEITFKKCQNEEEEEKRDLKKGEKVVIKVEEEVGGYEKVYVIRKDVVVGVWDTVP